jgi:hypothetical protein
MFNIEATTIRTFRRWPRLHITDHAISAKTSIMDPHNVIVFGELRPSATALPPLAQAKRRSARP